jgi:hypothetical protein
MNVPDRIVCAACICLVCVASAVTAAEPEEVHRAAPVGAYGGLMNPDVSAIVNMQLLFSDNRENEHRGDVRIDEAELAFQSYLYPGIAGDFIVAMHEHDGEWHIHPEEAYVSFQDLPFDFQLLAGRKLISFGRLNPTHPHHWKFASMPLVLENLFGEHPLFDDGAQLDWLVPNPWDLYCKIAFGGWAGASGSTVHHHDESDAGGEAHAIEWQGRTYNGRASLDLPVGELSNAALGYSVAWDEGYHTVVHGADLVMTYRRPMSYTRVKWHSEVFSVTTDDEGVSDPVGLFSLLSVTPNKYWELGTRYDWSEYILHEHHGEEEDAAAIESRQEWAVSAFVSYYFTHSLYLRSEYRHSVDRMKMEENQGIIQLVWGLGPHAHRLED